MESYLKVTDEKDVLFDNDRIGTINRAFTLQNPDLLSCIGKGILYIATPYSKWDDKDEACFAAAVAAANLIEAGHTVYSPIAHSHTVADMGALDNMDVENIWYGQNQPFINAAHALAVIMLPGWMDSSGIEAEIHEFRRQNKPVIFIKTDFMFELEKGTHACQ